MSSSYLRKSYAAQYPKGHRSIDMPTPASGIQAIIDARFDALIQRAAVLPRSNQISPVVNIDVAATTTDSTAQLGSALQK